MKNLNHEEKSSADFFYDVFLSFKGEGGTRYGFTDHLFTALRQMGIHTFKDDKELKIGAEIGPSLLKAIQNSRMLIVVLCQNYASSTWCLNELAEIVECYDKKGTQVLIVFYKVKPSDVWELKNTYADAMAKHEIRFGQDSKEVRKWRKTLSRVRDLPGQHCDHKTYEPELIKKIVKDTYAKLPPIPLSIKHVVGLDSRFEQVEQLLDTKSIGTVCMLEIHGAGGIGKTTFALDIYNKIRHQFEAASFLSNVREKSSTGKGLGDLQKALLSEMGEETETMMDSTLRGCFDVKRRFSNKRVLLVLDDVNDTNQLKALAGGGDWFGSGSRIIITTRDSTVLDKHKMDDAIKKKYKMEELNDGDSLELFCWHAFKMSTPAENFDVVSSRAVSYAKGVPLALKVIGSNLKGGSLEDWEVELDRYMKIPNAEIQHVLEISYFSLSELDRKTFLDIACFFNGERWVYVERILEARDYFPSIRVFVMKSLINIDENGCLDMHDLIQNMGREIIRKESPLNLGDRSRLWSHKEVLQVLKENSGSATVEGIMLDPPSHEEVFRWADTAFKKMENLRILIVRNATFSTAPSFLPNNLRVLDWKGYPSKSFPLDFNPQRIVDFKLPHSSLTLIKPFHEKFEDLTFINLSECQSMTQIPKLSGAINLRVLTLDRCHKVIRFDESIGFMPNLEYLSASECTSLKSFVPRMYLPALEVLSFNLCERLEHFPDVMQKMDKPLKIHMIGTAIKKFPKSTGNLTGLEYIDISTCRRLSDLSSSFLLLPKLATLRIDGCSQLGESFKRFKESHSEANGSPNLVTLSLSDANLSDEDLHAILESFPKLEDLNVSHNNFASIPKCIKGSLHLKSLDVSYCRNLMVIPELPLSLQKVDARYCRSLTSNASSMLWSKVCEEKEGIQVVMPKTKIPNWFDINCVSNEDDVPLFWARRKFPVATLALVFGDTDTFIQSGMMSHVVGLHLFIDGKEICGKDYHYCSVGKHHVLVCDLRILFSDEEWQGLDACLGDDWKAIQVQCESSLTLSSRGVYVYKQKTNTEDIQFKLPHPNSSGGDYIYMPMPPSALVPKSTLQMLKQRLRYASENMNPREIFGNYLPFLGVEDTPSFTKALLRSWRIAKTDMGEALDSASGSSIMQEHEESNYDVVRVIELMKENFSKHLNDSERDGMQIALDIVEQGLRARVEFQRKTGNERLDIDMPIMLEACHFGEAYSSRRYWGRLQIKHQEPTMKAVLRKSMQLARSRLREGPQEEVSANIVLLESISQLQSESPSTEEASTSGHEEEEYYDPILEELLMKIEEDAMRLNRTYGKLKASIVSCTAREVVSKKYLTELLYLRGLENSANGRWAWAIAEFGSIVYAMWMRIVPGLRGIGYNFKRTPYGRLRVADDGCCIHIKPSASRTAQRIISTSCIKMIRPATWLIFALVVYKLLLFLSKLLLLFLSKLLLFFFLKLLPLVVLFNRTVFYIFIFKEVIKYVRRCRRRRRLLLDVIIIYYLVFVFLSLTRGRLIWNFLGRVCSQKLFDQLVILSRILSSFFYYVDCTLFFMSFL